VLLVVIEESLGDAATKVASGPVVAKLDLVKPTNVMLSRGESEYSRSEVANSFK